MHNLKNEVKVIRNHYQCLVKSGWDVMCGVGGGSHIPRGWVKLHVTAPTTRVTEIKLILNHFQESVYV